MAVSKVRRTRSYSAVSPARVPVVVPKQTRGKIKVIVPDQLPRLDSTRTQLRIQYGEFMRLSDGIWRRASGGMGIEKVEFRKEKRRR
jgi:hypothetical protein